MAQIHPLWYLCIFFRVLLVLFIYFLTKSNVQEKGFLKLLITITFFIMGSGFLYKYITGSNNEVQIAKVFWHDSRIFHGLMYLLASYYFHINKGFYTSWILLLDVIGSIIYRISGI